MDYARGTCKCCTPLATATNTTTADSQETQAWCIAMTASIYRKHDHCHRCKRHGSEDALLCQPPIYCDHELYGRKHLAEFRRVEHLSDHYSCYCTLTRLCSLKHADLSLVCKRETSAESFVWACWVHEHYNSLLTSYTLFDIQAYISANDMFAVQPRILICWCAFQCFLDVRY